MAEEGLFEADRAELGLIGRPARELSELAPLTSYGPAVILAACNQKDGVGKTTSTINLGAALAEFGRKVLLADLDSQGTLSVGFGVPHEELDLTVYNLIVDDTIDVRDAIHHTKVSDLDLVPASTDLSAVEIQLVNEVDRGQALGHALCPMMNGYDFIIIDCQSSLGLLTVNALTIAGGIIAPTVAEYFSLRGLALLTDTAVKVRDRPNFNLEVSGILVAMFDHRTRHAEEVMEYPIEVFGDKVFDTVVTRTVRSPEASVAGEPITTWAPNTPAAAQYRNLAHEVIECKGRKQQMASSDNYTPGPSSGEGVQEEIISFRVALANFNGPFDLLLQFISNKKTDVTEVALAVVTDEFILYMRNLDAVSNLDEITGFLVVAATPLDLKTARLLPRGGVDSEEDLEPLEVCDLLFARLLQYQAYGKVVDQFEEWQKTAPWRCPRAVEPDKQFGELLPPVRLGMTLGEFVEFAVVVMRPEPPEEVGVGHIHGVSVSVPEQAGKILDSLWLVGEGTWLTFTQLTSECRVSMEVAGRFLVLLELYRAEAIGVEQEEALEETHVAQAGLDVDPAVVTTANWEQMACAGCWADFELGSNQAGLGLVGLDWAGLGQAGAIS